MKNDKRYSISYTSGATGYGWDSYVNTITEVKREIKGIKDTYTARVTVFDSKINDFVFYKRALDRIPETDLIYQ